MSSQINPGMVRRSRWSLGMRGLAAGAILALPPVASLAQTAAAPAGDVSYTLNVSASGVKNSAGSLKTEVALQGMMQRYDTTVRLPSGSSFHIVNMLDCAAGKVTTLDPDLKIYTVSDVSQLRPEVFGTGTLLPSFTPEGRGLFPLPDTRTAALSGGVGIAAAVTDKGMESVGKVKNAHHYTVTLTYTTTGGAEVPYPSQTFDVWTNDAQPQPLNCIDQRLLSGGASGAAVGGVTYTVTGDVDKLRAVLSAVPVQTTSVTSGAAGTILYTADKVSTKPIDAKTFAAPDAKMHEVSSDDFATDEINALKARAQGGSGIGDESSAGMRSTTPGSDPTTQGLNVPGSSAGGL